MHFIVIYLIASVNKEQTSFLKEYWKDYTDNGGRAVKHNTLCVRWER